MQNAQARSNIYALTSRLFLQELDDELLNMIRNDNNILEFFPTLREWENFSLENRVLINEYFNPDYTNIALLHLIPYESFYTRDDQKIETGGANPVTDMYSATNFMVDYEKARVVSSDHIGVELEFMHHLVEAQIKAIKDEDTQAIKDIKDMQKEFLNRHLLKWAPLYLLNAKYEARTPLYYDLADLTLEFILNDNEDL